ncbi:acyl carrier protein [Streptomyces sp. NPDC048275]|uniref:acyl carrier protein n=1 Tax=Streptomyces sp. NPDC048275 TaxID=3155629 RepID=UPI003405DFE4
MTSNPHPFEQEIPAVTEAEALTWSTSVLAELLKVQPDLIDPQAPFQALGFDSMLTVAFVAGLNDRYGTRLSPAVLSEHLTPGALARHLAGAHGSARPPRGAAKPAGGPTPVTEELRCQLAGLLHHAPGDLDCEAAFAELGLDSVLAAEFVAGLNQTYHLAEPATVLHDHPSLTALAAHIASHSPSAPTVSAPSGTPPVAPAAAAVDLEDLLDAVRDDVLSVDEAVALLADRA